MTEAISSAPQFSDKTRRALLLAGDRSLSKVKESGAYFITIDPNKEGDLNQEYWDIAVYLLSAKKKSEAVIKALQTRNKKLLIVNYIFSSLAYLGMIVLRIRTNCTSTVCSAASPMTLSTVPLPHLL